MVVSYKGNCLVVGVTVKLRLYKVSMRSLEGLYKGRAPPVSLNGPEEAFTTGSRRETNDPHRGMRIS